MNNYVGIDLGTTNSAICLFSGDSVRVLKSPEQNDVTPSAILIDRRGNKYVGKRAYDAAPGSPDNAALLFKRFMGSSTTFAFKASGESKTPEECSAEVLRVLFGYLPEEIRKDPEIGTVITIPAAFNQMQKNATVQAAHMAGIGKVALMQEPVAAVMSVMHVRRTEGVFLIYDLGGGTLDVAIAESMGGRVNLLANGGIQMCGGRDIDRAVFTNVVKPWLVETFDLPEDFLTEAKYKRLIRFANWAVERAKIELSAREESTITLSEIEVSTRDESGEEIYLDIPLTRGQLDSLMEETIAESVAAVRETIQKAGLTPTDIDRIVFIGGPTNYKPLRDKVSLLLGIAASTEVNPMTAVAEGAALFAESIDWESEDNSRKSSRKKMEAGLPNVSFAYVARTADMRARLVVQLAGDGGDMEFQVDSLDTGWTSGRMKLQDGATLNLTLAKNGENTFKVFVFAEDGQPLSLKENLIVIKRTTATVDIIPASHSIGVAVREASSNAQSLEWLVRAGDPLPKKGQLKFRAAESLKAGSSASLNFNLWEGEILDPITDNRPIGSLKVRGADFDDGVIAAGAELVCDYEILDSGVINLEVSVPSIGASFPSNHNFYSRQDGQMDFDVASGQIRQERNNLASRVEAMADKGIDDERIGTLKKKLAHIEELNNGEGDAEKTQEAMERLLETKKLLAQVRRAHLQEIRQMELDHCVEFFEENLQNIARPAEVETFNALRNTAQRQIERNSQEFEESLSEMRGNNFSILWRQDWFVISLFKDAINEPHRYTDRAQYEALIQSGMRYMQNDEVEQLRHVLVKLMQIKIYSGSGSDFMENVNIIKA